MRRMLAGLLVAVSPAAAVHAVDHSNLDEGRPVRMEDAYPISHGELSVEAGPGFISRRRQNERAFLAIDLVYGLAPNLHVELESGFFTDPHGEPLDEMRSGDIGIAALYNLNQETLALPALGVKLEATFPTGVDSRGADAEAKLMITKSIRRLSLHANAAYRKKEGTSSKERDAVYEHVIGASYPLGAPLHTRTTLAADLFVEQADRRGESNTAGAEGGIRHQLTQRVVVDAGLGRDLRGPRGRNALRATVGVSVAF